MKKFLSLTLASITVASALASCAPAHDRLDEAITVASSDAAKYATWLDERLDVIPNEITLGIGGDSFNIDMTEFADDGYVLRSMGDEVIAVGKTDAGLDRAVRAYAKAVEAGQTTDFDTVYNEGPRVKKLTIAGRDISEYVIRTTVEGDEMHLYAAEELQKYIGQATGYYPEIVTEDREHMIVLEQLPFDDPLIRSLDTDGFIISVKENGDLYITGGDYGCLFGAYEFLEKYVGWRFLYDHYNMNSFDSDYEAASIDYLYEAEHIDIPADLNDAQKPALISRNASRAGVASQRLRRKHHYGSGVLRAACHGLMGGPYKDFVDYDSTYGTQPCFTNETNIEIACEYYVDYCQNLIDSGYIVGKDLLDVDISQNDNMNFCMCKACMKLFKSEGCFTGSMLYFSNFVAEAVAEVDPRIYVLILVYAGTTTLPKNIRPLDNVSAAYCFYGDHMTHGCYSHSVDGYDCTGLDHKCVASGKEVSNERFGRELRDWNEVCNYISVWYYPGVWNSTAMSSPFLHRIYEDMMFFLGLENVKGIYMCPSGNDVNMGYIRPEEMPCQYVIPEMSWDGEMTYEEYLALIREYYYIFAGDGADELMDYYFDIQLRCVPDSCWGTDGYFSPTDRILFSEVRKYFDEAVAIFDRAKALAQTERQETFVEQLSQTMYFTGLVASHTQWYLEGDGESRAKYTKYFEDFKANALENAFDMYGFAEQHVCLTEADFDIEQNLGRLVRNSTTSFSLTEDWYLHE